jgi:hypothetical protein
MVVRCPETGRHPQVRQTLSVLTMHTLPSTVMGGMPKTLKKKTVQENVDDDRLNNRIFPGPTRYRE